MNKLVKIFNDDYMSILQSKKNPKYHLFFESHEWWMSEFGNEWNNDKKYIGYDYEKEKTNIKTINKCVNIPKKTITHKKLEELFKFISDKNINDFNQIRKELDKMYDYFLPSTILNLDTHMKNIKKNKNTNLKEMNVLIVGAGPIGLYTALYINEYYNKTQYFFNTHANILLLDNRIHEESIKMPYTRLTQFGFDISELQLFIKQIFCWKNDNVNNVRQFDFINILENLLYLCAYNNKIPMYFTKKLESYEKIKDFAKKHNFNYIFDCSGGRLDVKFKNVINWNKYKFKKNNYEIKLHNNHYNFFVDDKLYAHITVVIHLFDKQMKQFHVGNMFGTTHENDDVKLLVKYKNNCFETSEYIKLSKQFKSENIRHLLPMICEYSQINIKNVKYIKLSHFITSPHHLDRCAEVINNNLMYIGLGDTLGGSEYGIYFGMKSSMLLAKHIIHLLYVDL